VKEISMIKKTLIGAALHIKEYLITKIISGGAVVK